ncbi:hypothetical protein BVC80_7257g5 [Macleaya cordata]|uniref:Uncharacterized protein n=1 Tax=Macleaya cordata TaxID=56857 RepID=A0A200R8P6_MACCD|nr:hypothetical protein BVC80_7257g5 [Macleaya cordata]
MTAHEAPFGLRYQPTEADQIRAFQEKRWKAILTKKGFIREVTGLNLNHQPSLNGHFIRKGDSHPYTAFRELVIRRGVPALVVTSDLEKDEEEDEGIYEGKTSSEEEEEVVQVSQDTCTSLAYMVHEKVIFNPAKLIQSIQGHDLIFSTYYVENNHPAGIDAGESLSSAQKKVFE